MKRVLVQVVVVVVLAAALGAAPVSENNSSSKGTTPATQNRSKPYQVGSASWYGKSFDGKETASGEPYNMFRFTAAHMRLPLGSLVKVTNLLNGRSVVVKINDRGPTVAGRIIDLSYGAAQILGLRAHGVARVRLDLLSLPEKVILAQTVP
jgi:rare lipoprotein A